MVLDLLILMIFGIITLPKIKLCKSEIQDKLSVDDTGSIKGILCIAIFFNHFCGWFTGHGVISYLMMHCGSQAVSIFFFISSYGLYQRYGQDNVKNNFLLKRLTKLLIPYWLCMIVYSLTSVFAKIQIKTVINLKNIILAVFALVERSEIVENAWFVTAIGFMYITYFVCSRLLPNVNLSLKVFMVLVVFSIITKGRWITSLFSFPLGLLFAENEIKIRKSANKHYCFFIFSSLFVVLLGAMCKFWADSQGIGIATDLSDLVSGAAISVFTFLLLTRVKISNIFTRFLSKISYEVYLLHGLMIRISYLFFGTDKDVLFCLTAIAFTLLSSLIINKLSGAIQSVSIKGGKKIKQ